MNIKNIGQQNAIAGSVKPKAQVKSQTTKAAQPKDKFEPWVKKPEIHGAKDYFKNIGASMGNGAFGFAVVGGGKLIMATGMDGKPSTKIGGVLKSAVIFTTMAAGGIAGAGVGLAMGIFGRNAGELINAKHMQK